MLSFFQILRKKIKNPLPLPQQPVRHLPHATSTATSVATSTTTPIKATSTISAAATSSSTASATTAVLLTPVSTLILAAIASSTTTSAHGGLILAIATSWRMGKNKTKHHTPRLYNMTFDFQQ